jgi:hypothetical protein
VGVASLGDVVTLHPGDLGIDFSGARPSATDIARNGGKFVVRYSAGAGNTSQSTVWKLCGTGEIAAATAAGLDFIANSEWYESRVTEGPTAGRDDGLADLAFWKSRHLNRGASIYVSWDAAPAQSQWPQVDAYLRAYNAALGGYYHVDCYAGTPYLRHAIASGIIRYGWRPNAGSWSNDGLAYQPDTSTTAARDVFLVRALAATPAHMIQTGNYWYAKSADENLILRTPVGSHMDAAATPPPSGSTTGVYHGYAKEAAKVLLSADENVSLWLGPDGRLEIRKNHQHFAWVTTQP